MLISALDYYFFIILISEVAGRTSGLMPVNWHDLQLREVLDASIVPDSV